MTPDQTPGALAPKESRLVPRLLIGAALALTAVFIVVPMIYIFHRALAEGARDLWRMISGMKAHKDAAIFLISYGGAAASSLVSGQFSNVVPLVGIAAGYGALALITTLIVIRFAQTPKP